jgi:hypothetical protein
MIKSYYDAMSAKLEEWHSQDLRFFPFVSATTDPLVLNIEKLAHANYQEWHHEDVAKMSKDDGEVLNAYRMTVVENRHRSAAIEKIEQHFFDLQKETGEVCRLSILSLKKLHAKDVAPEKVKLLEAQIAGLLEAADNLYKGICAGTKRSLVFSHLKIYSN